MRLKFKNNLLYKIAGSMYIILSLVYLGLMYLLFKDNDVYLNGFIIFSFLPMPLSFGVGIYYFRLNTIDYIRLNDNELSIYKSLIFPRNKINILAIDQGRMIGGKLILILKNNKEIEIRSNLMSIKDFEKLVAKLKESILIG